MLFCFYVQILHKCSMRLFSGALSFCEYLRRVKLARLVLISLGMCQCVHFSSEGKISEYAGWHTYVYRCIQWCSILLKHNENVHWHYQVLETSNLSELRAWQIVYLSADFCPWTSQVCRAIHFCLQVNQSQCSTSSHLRVFQNPHVTGSQ